MIKKQIVDEYFGNDFSIDDRFHKQIKLQGSPNNFKDKKGTKKIVTISQSEAFTTKNCSKCFKEKIQQRLLVSNFHTITHTVVYVAKEFTEIETGQRMFY